MNTVGMSVDAIQQPGFTLEDIDVEKVKDYIKKAKASGRRKNIDEDQPLKALEKLELIKDGHPTLASIILFGKFPDDKIPQAVVHCGRFKRESVIIDDKIINGTVIEQIDGVMDFIRKNTDVRLDIKGKPARAEVWDYPLEALREAAMNAICHRDYTDNSDVQLKIYDDRFTIWNPGGLLPGFTIDDLYDPDHSSKPRNKLLAQILYDVGLIEKYGSGIQRIIDACKESDIPVPVFEERFGGFLVTFKRERYSLEYLKELGLTDKQIKAISYLKENGKITNKEYQRLTNVKRAQAAIELGELLGKGVIKRIGKIGAGVYYQLQKE